MKKAVTYVRVSSREQRDQGYSPAAQKRLLWEFAKNNGFDVIKDFEDAETAKHAGRKQFEEMIAYVTEHDIKNILVEKTDRLYRNFKDYSCLEDLIDQNGLTVYLIKENTALGQNATSQDKLVHGFKVLIAKNFLDNLSEEVKKGQKEKIQNGGYPGRPPLGYINAQDPETRESTIVIDTDNKPLIEALFTLYASGDYSYKSLIQKVESDGLVYSLRRMKSLSVPTVSKILQNPFYYGKARWGGELYDHKYEPLIDFDLWMKTQDAIKKNRSLHKGHKKNQKLFTYKGIFTCGECGRTITAEIKKGKFVYYRCTKYNKKCSQKAVPEREIDTEVEKILEQIHISDAGIRFIVEALKKDAKEKRVMINDMLANYKKQQTRLRNRLDHLYEDKLDQKISEDFYTRKYNEYSLELTDVTNKIAKIDQATFNYHAFAQTILELCQKASILFKQANTKERHQMMTFLLSNSIIKDKKPLFKLKKPFDILVKHSTSKDWQGQGESNPCFQDENLMS